MNRTYETAIIFDGSLPDETLSKEQEKIENFLRENADYEKTEIWGKRNLQSDIKKKKVGHYCFFIYNGNNDVPEKLQKLFKLNLKILRHMTVLYEKTPVISQEILERNRSRRNEELEEGDE